MSNPITKAPLAGNVHGCLLVSVAIVDKPRHILLRAVLLASERETTFTIKTLKICVNLDNNICNV